MTLNLLMIWISLDINTGLHVPMLNDEGYKP